MLKPKSIQIQTIDYCNRKCPWCPNSKIEKSPSSLMTWKVLLKIMDDLHRIHYLGSLHLYLMAEPLCDPRIVKIVKMVHSFFPDNVIFISTNGDHLKTREDVRPLFDAGLTWMGISNYDNRNDHLKEMKEFRAMVHTSLERLRETYYNRAGHIDMPCVNPRPFCDWVFQKAYINYRGDVILCCSDYKYEVILGNVMDKTFGEIYNSEEYNLYREAHGKGLGHKMPLCDRCNRIIQKEEKENVRRSEANSVL